MSVNIIKIDQWWRPLHRAGPQVDCEMRHMLVPWHPRKDSSNVEDTLRERATKSFVLEPFDAGTAMVEKQASPVGQSFSHASTLCTCVEVRVFDATQYWCHPLSQQF